MRRSLAARVAQVGVMGAGLLLVTADPAAADPAGPTNHDSTVTAVDPTDVPVAAEVLGGDAFMVLEAEPGVVVDVPGYDGEPYLRFEADGTVRVNERSPARWLNDARYGEAEVKVPPVADADAEPVFVEVAGDGRYAWHDHRIHFMSPGLPAQVDPGAGGTQPVSDWEVPLSVDGQAVTVRGELVWVAGPSPLLVGALLALALAAAVVLAVRRPGLASPLGAVAALAALGVTLSQTIGLPPGSEAPPVPLVLAGLACLLVALGAGLARRAPDGDLRGHVVTAAAGAPLLVWAVLHLGALTRPIVPGPLPTVAVRTVVLVAVAAGIAVLGVLVSRGLQATSLDDPRADAPA